MRKSTGTKGATTSGMKRISRRLNRRDQLQHDRVVALRIAAVFSGDGNQDTAAVAEPGPRGDRLGDAGEVQGEILIILERNDAANGKSRAEARSAGHRRREAGSAAPEAALGLMTDLTPCGRSSGCESCPALTMPALPMPLR